MTQPKVWFTLLALLSLIGYTGQSYAGKAFRVSADPIKGEVINMDTREVVMDAVVNASWVLEPANGDNPELERRLTVQQVEIDENGYFTIPGWSSQRKVPEGWRLKPGFDPVITVFSNGFYHGEFRNVKAEKNANTHVNPHGTKRLKSVWETSQFMIQPFSDYIGDGVYVGPQWSVELGTWQYFMDTEIQAYQWKNKARAKVSQMKLLSLLRENCEIIVEIEQDSICSEIGINRKQTAQSSIETSNSTSHSQPYQEADEPRKIIIQRPSFSFEEAMPN